MIAPDIHDDPRLRRNPFALDIANPVGASAPIGRPDPLSPTQPDVGAPPPQVPPPVAAETSDLSRIVPGGAPDDRGPIAKTQDEDPDKFARVLDALGGAFSRKGADTAYWENRAAQRRNAALQDPNSAESQQARAANAPLLKSLGLTDEEISRLPASAMGNGSQLVQGIAQSRARAKQEQAKQADEAAKEGRAAEEWNRRNAITAPQQLEASRQQGALALEREKAMVPVRSADEEARAKAASDRSLENQRKLAAEAEQRRIEAEDRAEKRRIEAEQRKAGLAGDQQEMIASWERMHPGLHVDEPTQWLAAHQNARGITKMRNDGQQVMRLLNATDELRHFIAARDAAGLDVTSQYTNMKAYHTAVEKASGALGELAHANTEARQLASQADFPGYTNPLAAEQLDKLEHVFHAAGNAVLSEYGASVDTNYRPPPAAKTPQPATNKPLSAAEFHAQWEPVP